MSAAVAREIEAREAAEAHAKELEPKVEVYDKVMSIDGTYSIGEVGKLLAVSRRGSNSRVKE